VAKVHSDEEIIAESFNCLGARTLQTTDGFAIAYNERNVVTFG